MLISILCLFGAIIMTSVGHIFYKFYFLKNKIILLFLTIMSFLMVTILSYQALKLISLDIVYASTAITIPITTFFSVIFLNEKLNKYNYISILLTISGVLIYNIKSLI